MPKARDDSRQREDWSAFIARIARGDETALAALYDESSPLIYGIILRIVGNPADAEETTADVYAQVWRAAPTFDAAKSNPAGWLTMMARSRAIDRYRSKLNRIERDKRDFAPFADLQDSNPQPEFQSILAQRRTLVLEAMTHLRPDERQAIELAFFLGYTHTELAARQGVTLGTIKSRIRTGLHRLNERLAPFIEKSRASHG
jgi:RNA polymerase sigma-70 factor (ECF subfamily)